MRFSKSALRASFSAIDEQKKVEQRAFEFADKSGNVRSKKHFRLLVGSADPELLKNIALACSETGYPHDNVGDLEKTLQLAKNRYSLIMIDQQLSPEQGVEMIKAIRRVDAPRRHTPVVALLDDPSLETRQAWISAGADGILVKPCLVKDIQAMLHYWDMPIDSNMLPADAAENEFLQQMVNRYISEVPPRVSAMRKFLASQNTDALKREAHYVKGASCMFRAKGMITLCLEIEALAMHKTWSTIPSWLDALEEEFKRVRAALQNELCKTSPKAA